MYNISTIKRDLAKGLLYGFFVTGIYTALSFAVYTTMRCRLGESPTLDICFSFLGNDHPTTILTRVALIIPFLLGLGVFVYTLKTKRVVPGVRAGFIALLTFFLLSIFILNASNSFYQPGTSYGHWAFARFLVVPWGWLNVIGAVALYLGMMAFVVVLLICGKIVGKRV